MSGGMNNKHVYCPHCKDWFEKCLCKQMNQKKKLNSENYGCASCGQIFCGEPACTDFITYVKNRNNSEEPEKMSATNDEELARLFFNAASKCGVPRIPEGAYGSGEVTTFEDLSLRQVKQMAAFVRELRK